MVGYPPLQLIGDHAVLFTYDEMVKNWFCAKIHIHQIKVYRSIVSRAW